MAAHARFAPSAMHRIIRCPGSVRATAGMVEVPSPYADDGIEAHALLAYALNHGIREAVDAFKSNTISWTHRTDTYEERIDSVQDALDYVCGILDSYEDAKLYVETSVHFPSHHTDDCWGTADIVIFVPSLALLYVLDFKHGAGKWVPIEENEQTETYGCGALGSLGDVGNHVETVITGIIQPRAFSESGTIRTDVRSLNYYQTVAQPRIDNAIAAAMKDDAPLIPGDVQCQFCPRKANCPAREAAALAVVSDTFKSVKDVTTASLPAVSQLPIDRLAFIMAAASVLKGWLTDVEDAAYQFAAAGAHVPGFKLVEAMPRRRWHDDEEVTSILLQSLTGLDEDTVMPRKLIGITEAEKLVKEAYKARAPRGKKRQAAEEAVNAMAPLTTKETSGNLALVPETDRRPAINVAKIAFQTVVALPPPQ